MTNNNLVKNPMLRDLDIFETIEVNAASKVVGGQDAEIVKYYEPYKVGNSWILPFITVDDNQVCLGAGELEVEEVGGIVIAEIEREIYCVGLA